MTTVPVTLPAVTSLLTGRLPPHHGVRDNDRFVLDPAEETLAERFQAAGWRTGAVLGSAILARDRGLAQGFDTYDDTFADPFPVYDPTLLPLAGELSKSQRRADVVTNRALTLVKSFGPAPYFLFVHYFDAHMFYDPPPGHAALHPGRPYDGEISFVDAEIGRLLRGIGPRRDALVVVVSDHGEANGDHGEPQHGFLLYQATLRVAALASGAGVPAGAAARSGQPDNPEPAGPRLRPPRMPARAMAARDWAARRWPPFEYARRSAAHRVQLEQLRAVRPTATLVEGAGRPATTSGRPARARAARGPEHHRRPGARTAPLRCRRRRGGGLPGRQRPGGFAAQRNAGGARLHRTRGCRGAPRAAPAPSS
jgi:hypothetical protein